MINFFIWFFKIIWKFSFLLRGHTHYTSQVAIFFRWRKRKYKINTYSSVDLLSEIDFSHFLRISWTIMYFSLKGSSLKYVGWRGGGGGLAKCLCYYISLCSKLTYGGERGSKSGKSFLRSLWMVPNNNFRGTVKSTVVRL